MEENIKNKRSKKLIFDAINNKLKIKYPNYYQITSFINILGEQLKKFSQSNIFSSHHLQEDKENIYRSKDIRTYLIEKFIFSMKYFIDGRLINLINNQTKTYRLMNRYYNEKIEYDEELQKLAKERDNSLSFKDIENTLLLFSEKDADEFDIISNKKNKEDYERYIKIIESQSNLNNIENNHIKNDNKNNNNRKEDEVQKYFIEKLKKVLNINKENEEINNNKISEEKKEKNIKKEEKNKVNKLEEEEDEEEEEEDDEEEDNFDICKINKNLPEKTSFILNDNYIFTDENYLKIALILLRIRAQIPVILMGETGCGKTFLIRKLSEILNNGDKTKLKTLNIHSGINDRDIIKFLKKEVIPEAKKLKEKDKAEGFRSKGYIFYETKLWVFLDNINTCKSMGLISEILCKRSFQGNRLPSNIAIIAACNPYRINSNILNKDEPNIINEQNTIKNNLKNQKEKDKFNNISNYQLIYNVNPLPHSLLNFVYYFGRIGEEEEKKYIINIIEKTQEEFYNKYQIKNYNEDEFRKICDLVVNMIVESQNFIKSKNDISSVSLREINRFNIIFQFFCDYLKEKKDFDLNREDISYLEKYHYEFYTKLNYKDIHIYSIILSIFVCYYLRIPNNDDRKELDKILRGILYEYDKNYSYFLEIPLKEEKFIAESIDLKKGIALNKALLDSLFALFVAINTKIPIFIIGKTGCGKSLSVELINKSMRGKASKKLLFKNLPEIIMNYYQGSMENNSKGIKIVFNQARNILKNIKNQQEKNILIEDKNNNLKNEIISLICFDMMDLCEQPQNNYLKAVNSELDYELNESEKKVVFVGISNRSLDSSIMNRGLILSITEPDWEDAKFTAYSIGMSYNLFLANTFKSYYESLGDIYYYYKQYLMSQITNGLEFHGNRDFYYSVKNVAKNINKENTNFLSQVVKIFFIKTSIERNFAGLVFERTKETSLKRIKKYYRYYDDNLEIEDKYDVKDAIDQNIEDLESRYLLAISKPSIIEFLLKIILNEKNKEYVYYKGSPFKDDLKSEKYNLKMLNKIQVKMEQGKVLILNNLEIIYPSLYDLFNQNFKKVGKKNYAKIGFGYRDNSYSLVNDKFKCIVIVDNNKIKKEEPQFLNRFEKHIISFENILEEHYLNKFKDIYNILFEMIQNNGPKKEFLGINYDLEEIFINLDKEEINAYIFNIYNKNINNIKFPEFLGEITDKVIEKLSLLLPQDIILFKTCSGFDKIYPRIAEKILEEYNKGEHVNFSLFLKKMKNMKNIIYTFSDFFSDINIINNIENEILGKIQLNNITTIEIISFTTEVEFEDKLNEKFFNDKNKKLCIIKFQSNERHFLNYVKFIIEKKEKETNFNDNEKIKKAFVFIVYLNRTFNDNKKVKKEGIDMEEKSKYNETISLTSEFYQIFIDDLNGSEEYAIKDIYNLSRGELVKKWIKFDSIIKKGIYKTLSFMDYNIEYEYQGITKNNYPKKIIKILQNNDCLKEKINQVIIQQMEKDENLIKNALNKKDLVTIYDTDIISCIRLYLSEVYFHLFNNFYYIAEKDQFFSALLFIEESKEKEKNEINILNQEDKNEIKEISEKDLEKEIKDKEIKQNLVKKVIEIYFDNFLSDKNKKYLKDIKYINMIEKLESNKVDIILGLQLPGMFSIISSIINRSRNDIIKKYLINENNLRKFIEDENIIKERAEYDKKLKDLNNILFIDLDKSDKIKSITLENQFVEEVFVDLFLDDYYTIFIHNNLNNIIKSLKKNKFDLSELKTILYFIVKQNEEALDFFKGLDKTAYIINWIEAYSIEISYILKAYIMLRNYINKIKKGNKEQSIYDLMEELIKDGKVNYGEDENRQEYITSKVNKALFNSFESILKIITSCKELFTERKGKNEILELLIILKEIFYQMNKFNMNLKLYSKELLSLQEIIEIINGLIINDNYTSDKLDEIIKYFSESKENNLIENFEKFFYYLEKIFEKNESFYKMISIVFKNEFVKNNSDDEFKKKIIQIIISKNEYILNSNQLLKIILDFDIRPSKIRDN